MRALYFITFNTFPRRPILDNAGLHAAFIRFAETGFSEHQIAVGRYVIMPDHVHLFVFMPEAALPLTQWMQALKSVLGKTLLQLEIEKPHWQEGFFDHLLRNGESYAQKWDYVRANPVRAGLCASADQWPYQGEIVVIEFD